MIKQNNDDFFDDIESELKQNKDTEDTKNISFNISKNLEAESPEFSSTIEDNYDFIKNNINNKNDSKWSNFSWMNGSPYIFPNSKPKNLLTLEKWRTRFITVWWQEEVGKNMSIIEYGEEIIIIDWWAQFPENNMLWAKYSLPDISFLIPLKNKIKAILVTHWHLDHILWLKHLLPALWFPPIYWAKLTLGLIKKSLEDWWVLNKAKFIEINPDSAWMFKIWSSFNVEFFRENHNIPDACGIYIETPNAKIVNTWDFKFDFTPSIDKPANLTKIAEIWARWIDLLLSDSTNSLKDWFTKTEADIWTELFKIISEAHWRIIIATFASLIWRMQQVIESAEKTWKTVFLNWRSMVENVKIGRELGYIKCNINTIKKLTNNIDSVPDNKQIILTTWSQWEELSWLYRMAYWEHPIIKIKPWDSIVLSSSPVPWNEKWVINMMNELIKLGWTLYTKEWMDIHTSWHCAREEQKIMINLIKPRYFIPIHWELYQRVAHKKTAISLGVIDKNVFLMDNWSILDIEIDKSIKKSKFKLNLEEIIVDGQWIWIATSHVIAARAQMMKSWVVVIVFKVDEKTKTILGPLKIETRWLVYLDEVREVHRMIINKAKSSFMETISHVPDIEEKELIKIIKKDTESYLMHKIWREPMIVPIIMYV